MACCRHLPNAVTPGFARDSTEPRYAPDLGLEPVHMELDLRVDVFERSLDGDVLLSLVCRTDGWRELSLDAVDFDQVQVSSPQGHELEWRYDGDRIHVSFEDAPGVGEGRQLRVRYRVSDPLTGLLFAGKEVDLGESPVFAATDHETERARYWLPCVDHPSVRTTLEFRLRADARLTALANGAKVGVSDHDDGTRTTEWHLEHPCPSYLLCFAIGDFVRFDGGEHDERPIAAFAPHPYTTADLERSFGPTGDMLAWMTDKLGHELPWPKYFQFAVPGIGGAMENISLVSWDDAWVTDARLRDEMGWIVDFINVHEMAHTWFGDLVVCRDFAHTWLKESWATYMEIAWLEDVHGLETALTQLHDEARNYTEEADERYARPIVTRRFDSSWDMFDRHLYPGGAWRLHMLRHKLGDRSFWEGVQAYLDRFAGKVVETDDFRRALEEASGRSLARFFEQWFQSPGYPKLKASWTHDAEQGQGTLSIEQKQQDDAKGIGLFHLELEVAIQRADGSWIRRRVQLEDQRGVLVVALDRAPQQVIVDPDMKALFRLNFDPGHDMLARALPSGNAASKSSDDAVGVRGRIHAIRSLCKRGRARDIQAVRSAWPTLSHWHMRRIAARYLGEAGAPAARRALISILEEESDPRVFSAITSALGKYRDRSVGQALASWIEGGDERPYRATAAALTSLGKQRGTAWTDAWLDLLAKYARDDSDWWGWVQRGAVTGLGHSGQRAAVDVLVEVLDDAGTRPQVRAAAAEALGRCGRRQERPQRQAIVERLAQLVHAPDYPVRLAAGRALKTVGESSGVPALKRLKKAVSVQHEATIDRHIRALEQSGEGSREATLQRRIDSLSDKLGKLHERLDKLEAQQQAE